MAFSLGGSQLLRIQGLRLSEHRRTRQSQKMMTDLLARIRGREPIRREEIRKLEEEVGDALRSGENGSTETRGQGQSRRGEADRRGTRRGRAKHALVGYIQEKMVMAEKICSKDGKRHRSQLKRPVKPMGTKT